MRITSSDVEVAQMQKTIDAMNIKFRKKKLEAQVESDNLTLVKTTIEKINAINTEEEGNSNNIYFQ